MAVEGITALGAAYVKRLRAQEEEDQRTVQTIQEGLTLSLRTLFDFVFGSNSLLMSLPFARIVPKQEIFGTTFNLYFVGPISMDVQIPPRNLAICLRDELFTSGEYFEIESVSRVALDVVVGNRDHPRTVYLTLYFEGLRRKPSGRVKKMV